MKIHFSTYLFRLNQHLEQGDQLEKGLGIEPSRRKPEGVGQWWIGPVGPFACDTKAAALQLAEDQRINTGYASFLEYLEALAAQWVEGWRISAHPNRVLKKGLRQEATLFRFLLAEAGVHFVEAPT